MNDLGRLALGATMPIVMIACVVLASVLHIYLRNRSSQPPRPDFDRSSRLRLMERLSAVSARVSEFGGPPTVRGSQLLSEPRRSVHRIYGK